MRNIRQIVALWDTYTDSRATRALYDTYSGEELLDLSQFQPFRNFYPREVVEANCFRLAREGETATHVFDPSITDGPRYRFPIPGVQATHVNDWRFPMFPDYALFRRAYNSESETETEADDKFDGDEEVIGRRLYAGRDDLFEERIRISLFDESQTGGEVEPFWSWYRDVLNRVGWFVYPPLNNIRMVNGTAEFLSREPWYGRIISEVNMDPEEASVSTVAVDLVIEVSRVPYNTETDPAVQTQTSGRIEDVYPGGFV